MDIKQSFYTAIRNLCVHKMRSVQVMCTLVAAVAAIIMICNTCWLVVQQVEISWTPEILSNTNMDISSRIDLNRRPSIEDLEKIAKNNPDIILGVSPYVVDSLIYTNLRYDDKNYQKGNFYGVNEQYADMHCIKLKEGRFIQYMDCQREQYVCVVGTDLVNNLFEGNALGKIISIYGYNFTVVGVADDETEGLLYLPYTCAHKMIGDEISTGYQGNKYYSDRFEVKANGVENIDNVRNLIQDEMDKLLGANRSNWSLTFTSYQFVKEEIIGASVRQAFNYMLLALFVLLIGGVSIMNVMLANVQARTKEIGIRKAFGATNKDIHWQFRLEAMITSLFGGLLGVVLGVILSFSVPWLLSDIAIGSGMSYSTEWLDISIAAWPILLALGLAVGVGVLFGTYPAQQAAKMEPVAAINSD